MPYDGQLLVSIKTDFEGHTPNLKIRQWCLDHRSVLAVAPPPFEGRFKLLV